MNVVVLPDRRSLDAVANLEALIERARKLQVFGPTVDFDATVWDLSSLKIPRPTAVSMQAGRLYFTTGEGGFAKSLKGSTPFAPSFAGLVKALVVLDEFSRPKGMSQHKAIVRAARALYDVLAGRGHDPTTLTSDDFVKAARSLCDGYAVNTQYSLGQKLEKIADDVNRYGVSKVRIVFSNPNPRPMDARDAVDEEMRSRTAEKMASDEAVDAIIAMSIEVRAIGDDRDVLYAATTELLMCAPWRINEELNLLVDCERREGSGAEARLGIAYRGSKGYAESIKWVPTDMVPIAERALADIRRITARSRDIAQFMEDHPGRAWLPEPWRLADPASKVTSDDVCEMIGLSSAVVALRWIKSKKIGPISRRGTQGLYRLADIERVILTMQPKLPPGSPPLSKYLFLIPRWFGGDKESMWPVVTFVTDGRFADFLSGRLPGRSVFERLNICEAEGKPYSVRSHQIRHFLNNLAQEGTLPQLDIARWSGRKDVAQNAVYDHTGGMPLAKTMREMLKTDAMKGPIADTFSALPSIDRETFLKSRLSTAHLTEIGCCVQDWSLAPCPSHGACAGCGDHLVIKGDPKRRDAAKRLLAEHEGMLAAAKAEMSVGTYGASNWVEHNRKLVEGLRRVVAVHEDESLPDGAPVQIRSH